MPNGNDPRGVLVGELGLRVAELRQLTSRLELDFRVEDWGFSQFGDIADVGDRAIVSDHLLASAEAILTNLLEARVSELDYNAATQGGIPYAEGVNLGDIRHDQMIVSFFRAFGSALDCLAGVAIGVLRIPAPIIRASMQRHLLGLDPAQAATADATLTWQAFRDLIDALRAAPPAGWMDWALAYRNALLHRPRQLNMMLPREPRTELIVPPWRERELARFDLFLRRRPWLPELQHLAAERPVEDLFLHEPASQTLRGLIDRLNQATEGTAAHLHAVWCRVADGLLQLPAPAWPLDAEPDVEFAGFAPLHVVTGRVLYGHTQTATRAALAERLRRRLASD